MLNLINWWIHEKNVLIILISLSTLNLFSQIEKERVIVSVDGNYMKTTTEDGATSNKNVFNPMVGNLNNKSNLQNTPEVNIKKEPPN